MIKTDHELLYPPKEIFLSPESVSWDWDLKSERLGEKAEVEYPKEGGILYYPNKNYYPFKGFPFPPATAMVAVWKRVLINKLKRPLTWFGAKRELEELANHTIKIYYLKPEFYCKPVREIYRVGIKFFREDWVHNFCMILQWDSTYRFRVQVIGSRVDAEKLAENPRKEISRILRMGERTEPPNHPLIKAKWRLVRRLFNLLWFVFGKYIKKILMEINFGEFEMDEADKQYAFKR